MILDKHKDLHFYHSKNDGLLYQSIIYQMICNWYAIANTLILSWLGNDVDK